MSSWNVPCSDGESVDEEFLPPPEIIVELYKKLSKGEELKFDAKIYPRREATVPVHTDSVKEVDVPITPEKVNPQEKTEFDFSTQPEEDVKRFTPRRTPSKPQTKKVGKIENVFSDIMKYQKLDKEKGLKTSPNTK